MSGFDELDEMLKAANLAIARNDLDTAETLVDSLLAQGQANIGRR